jgi:hypothetical protein
MAKRQIFYSFHFDNDVMRVQQIRNMGALEENEPVSVNQWEEVKKGGDSAIEQWIADNMRYRTCVVVLVGAQTANRKWVKYEIRKAWQEGKGIVGIHIHNLKCPRNGCCNKGTNPFEQFTIGDKKMSAIVKCYDPGSDAYSKIYDNIEDWVEEAIRIRNNN